MRILVTGGAGYIGSHAVRLFLESGHNVWILDDLKQGHRAAVPGDVLQVGDLADRGFVTDILRRHGIEAVVHFAALTYVGESVKDPGVYYQNNVANTLGLLECMRSAGVNRIVFSSTAATYGNPQRVPISKDDPLQPINPYGNGKFMIELALADYARAYGWSCAALRYFNAAGASPDGLIGEDHDPETHLIPIVLQVALGQRPGVEIFGTDYPTPDGTCIRDYVHVDDLANAHLLVLEHLKVGQKLSYNLGTARGYSVRDVIQTCEKVTGRSIACKESARREGDPPSLVASPEKIMRELNWQPKYDSLDAIVKTAWNWHSKHPHGYSE